MDPTVVEALKRSLEADPGNQALRLHYASVLMQANDASQALEQAVHVLSTDPANIEALRIGAEAADSLGNVTLAAGYRRLIEGLGWATAKHLVGADDQTPVTCTYGDDEFPDDPFVDEPDVQPRAPWRTERSIVTLNDVAGMSEVKRRLQVSFLGPMQNPELRQLYGKSLRGGLLLYGPPGCGKTFIARAIAGELGAGFISVGLTDVVDMWLGQSEKNLHELFQTARQTKPCVLFMDELDALGRKRSLMRHHAGRGIINQLLAELDGAEHENDGVFFLAATNHPWDVDSALRRPGRLDRVLLVLPPDEEARASIIAHSLQNRPTERIDVGKLAQKTDEFSGADIVHLCDSAAELALERSLARGAALPITMADFSQAMKDVKPSTRPWLETAKNHAIYANEGGAYDSLFEYLKKRRMV